MAGTEFLDKFKEKDESNLDISDASTTKRERPKHQYTKELLLEMRTLPLSQRKPSALKQFSQLSIVTSDEKPETKTTTTKKFMSLRAVDDVNRNDHKNGTSKNGFDERKPYDAKERLQKENQDIILSPQRRSFNTGCYISNDKKEIASTTDKQPSNNGREREIINSREKDSSRRYNSNNNSGGGRYVREAAWGGDSHKNQNAVNTNSRDERSYNRNSNNYNRDNNSQMYNRNNNFDRKYFENNQRPNNQRDRRPYFNSNDSRNNYRSNYTEEEPEWFNTGPITQDDTIELRGFDEEPNNDEDSNITSETNNSEKEMEKRESKETTKNDSIERSENSSDTIEVDRKMETEETDNKSKDEVKPKMTCNIDIEAFLKLDLLPEITMRGESAGSKFTRWFKRDESNEGTKEATTSANDTKANECDVKSSNHLMNMLQSSKENSENTQKSNVCIQELEAKGKLHSVEEIELKLRGLTPKKDETATKKINQKKEEDSIAFQNLLLKAVNPQESSPSNQFGQIFGQRNSSATDATPSSLSELNEARNVHVDEFNKKGNDNTNKQHPGLHNALRSSPLTINNFQQQQQDMACTQNSKQEQDVFAKLMASANSAPQTNNNSQVQQSMKNPLIPKDILQAINGFRINDEVVQKVETYNIMKALQVGEITQYQLIEQLKKTTSFQSKFRESVLCVLKILHDTHTLQLSAPPPGFSRDPPPLRLFQDNSTATQNLRMNFGNNVTPPRDAIPISQFLLQNIHLTDQKSNGPRGPSGNALLDAIPSNSNNMNNNSTPDKKDTFNCVGNSAVAPFSFTPTSVLRNIVTDKDVSLDSLSKKLSRNASPTSDQNVTQSPVAAVEGGSLANNIAQQQQAYINSMAQGNNVRYPNMINMMQRPIISSPTPQNGIPLSGGGMMNPPWHNIKQMQDGNYPSFAVNCHGIPVAPAYYLFENGQNLQIKSFLNSVLVDNNKEGKEGSQGMLQFQIPRGHLPPPHPQMMTNANFNRKLSDLPMGLGPLLTHPNGFITQPIGPPPPISVNNTMVGIHGMEDNNMQSNQLNHWFSSSNDMVAAQQQRAAAAAAAAAANANASARNMPAIHGMLSVDELERVYQRK